VQGPAHVLELFKVNHATKSFVANLTRTPMSFLNDKDSRDQNYVFNDSPHTFYRNHAYRAG